MSYRWGAAVAVDSGVRPTVPQRLACSMLASTAVHALGAPVFLLAGVVLGEVGAVGARMAFWEWSGLMFICGLVPAGAAALMWRMASVLGAPASYQLVGFIVPGLAVLWLVLLLGGNPGSWLLFGLGGGLVLAVMAYLGWATSGGPS